MQRNAPESEQGILIGKHIVHAVRQAEFRLEQRRCSFIIASRKRDESQAGQACTSSMPISYLTEDR
jgi:hypothetical protein